MEHCASVHTTDTRRHTRTHSLTHSLSLSHTHAHKHTHRRARTHEYTRTHTYARMHACMHACMHARTHASRQTADLILLVDDAKPRAVERGRCLELSYHVGTVIRARGEGRGGGGGEGEEGRRYTSLEPSTFLPSSLLLPTSTLNPTSPDPQPLNLPSFLPSPSNLDDKRPPLPPPFHPQVIPPRHLISSYHILSSPAGKPITAIPPPHPHASFLGLSAKTCQSKQRACAPAELWRRGAARAGSHAPTTCSPPAHTHMVPDDETVRNGT